MDFQTHYKRNPAPPESNSGEKLVETAGYITAQQRIEAIINAGHRLSEFRKEQFDFGTDEELDEDFDDPTRSKNFDRADASIIEFNIALRERIKREGIKAREAELKALQTAQKPQNEASKNPEGV